MPGGRPAPPLPVSGSLDDRTQHVVPPIGGGPLAVHTGEGPGLPVGQDRAQQLASLPAGVSGVGGGFPVGPAQPPSPRRRRPALQICPPPLAAVSCLHRCLSLPCRPPLLLRPAHPAVPSSGFRFIVKQRPTPSSSQRPAILYSSLHFDCKSEYLTMIMY